ncbi:putative folate-biopterin transporter 4 [Hibiscus syriacus]|uniref:Folate-biopterin transporter 4 n=1 Tax=Hibiscus syriacus TaxID=106335 RepID=A0A6A2XU20_HIBSY|nr:probable folate-biopterin transporter 4 [Hibiscus syriacus]KAE8679132.1 putative folate-biopterin transporter 4 [Hibiscus syriacus]
MIEWIKQLKTAFGLAFLWLVCLIYYTQGFRSFVWTSISYQLKDRLKLSPSASQFVLSVSIFPWSIKPVYGILSDCIPIRGKKRIPYLVIATVTSLVSWLILGINSSARNSMWHLMVLLTLQNLGSAMADVVIDAMIAEAVRSEKASFAGDLQSLSWLSMAFGGVCGSLLGGYALNNLEINIIFLLFSVLPATQLFSCGLVKEYSMGSDDLFEFSNSSDSHHLNGNTNYSDEDTSLERKSYVSARKRKNKKKSKKTQHMHRKAQIQNPGTDKSLPLVWFQSLKDATYSLCCAFKQPIILRPMAWFFLAHVTVPNLSTIMFYYQTEFLKMEASFLGTVRVIGWLGLMLGTFTYNRYLKKMKLRTILAFAHIGLAFLNLFDFILVSRINVQFGVSDKTLVLCGSALSDAVNQFKLMPFLILSGQLCPPGIEGTLFALFMSINNFGSTVGSFVGAGLASILNISSGSFDNLLLGIVIQIFCTFIPVELLFLIPKEVTGIAP